MAAAASAARRYNTRGRDGFVGRAFGGHCSDNGPPGYTPIICFMYTVFTNTIGLFTGLLAHLFCFLQVPPTLLIVFYRTTGLLAHLFCCLQVPVGAGLGLAHKLKKDGNCSFALYGDGAANQGQIAESFNMCAIWDIPTVFVCENNHYGMGTADYKGAKSSSFYQRGDYIPGIHVDGMDVLAMKAATVFAKDWAVKNGPIIMEADTYRCVPIVWDTLACMRAWH